MTVNRITIAILIVVFSVAIAIILSERRSTIVRTITISREANP